jgi:hypothetical protein
VDRRNRQRPEWSPIAEAVIGPKPGMLISRRAVSSFCASLAMMRSSRAIASSRLRNCTTSGATASHTSNGIVSSQASMRRPTRGRVVAPAGRSRQPRPVPAQSVEQLRALRDQQLSGLVAHQNRLVLERAHADKPHRRPAHRLSSRRRPRRRSSAVGYMASRKREASGAPHGQE